MIAKIFPQLKGTKGITPEKAGLRVTFFENQLKDKKQVKVYRIEASNCGLNIYVEEDDERYSIAKELLGNDLPSKPKKEVVKVEKTTTSSLKGQTT